jgi:hypothetical protein
LPAIATACLRLPVQVSEVLSLSLSMQGIFRPPHLCKQRFRQITVSPLARLPA